MEAAIDNILKSVKVLHSSVEQRHKTDITGIYQQLEAIKQSCIAAEQQELQAVASVNDLQHENDNLKQLVTEAREEKKVHKVKAGSLKDEVIRFTFALHSC